MTLNAAFIKVFGEGLEPYGFKRLKKIKNKQPYYVRVINGELLNIVTYRQVSSNKLHYKCIEVLVGVVSLYRRNLDFLYYADNPDICLSTPIRYFGTFNIDVDKSVMDSAIQFDCDIWGDSFEHRKKTYYYGPSTDPKILYKSAFSRSIRDFLCKADDADEMLACMNNAFNSSKAVFLPFFDIVSDIRTFVDYLFRGYLEGEVGLSPLDKFIEDESDGWSEGLTLIKAGYRYDGNEEMKEDLAQYLSRQSPNTPQEKIEELRRQYEQRHAEQLALRLEMHNPELNKRVMEELERCKAKNIEALKSYGISLGEDDNITAPYFKKADAKAKPMSLNAAFKQVFGEALEPLGFKLIKSKYPYFVKVVPGGEIVHIISYMDMWNPYPGRKTFDILGGIATVYRPKIDLSILPSYNGHWLSSISRYYSRLTPEFEYDDEYRKSIYSFEIEEESKSSLYNAMNYTLELTRKYIIPQLDTAVDLKSSLSYLKRLGQSCSRNSFNLNASMGVDEGLLYIITDDKGLKSWLEKVIDGSLPTDEKTRQEAERDYKFFNDPVIHEKVLLELDRRKAANTEILRSYGLEI